MVQEDKISKHGKLDRRFLDGSYFFRFIKDAELALYHNFCFEDFEFDVLDFMYVYFFLPSEKPVILDEYGFSLNDEENEESLSESVRFYGGIYDYKLNNFFNTGLDIFREGLRCKSDVYLESKFISLFLKVNKGQFKNRRKRLEKRFSFISKSELLNLKYSSFLCKDLFVDKPYRFGFDDMVLKLYYQFILDLEVEKDFFCNDENDFSFFEFVRHPEPKIIKSSLNDVLLFEIFDSKIDFDCYFDMFGED